MKIITTDGIYYSHKNDYKNNIILETLFDKCVLHDIYFLKETILSCPFKLGRKFIPVYKFRQ